MRRLSGSLKVEFEEVLVEPWSLYLAAVMIAMISTWLLVSGFYWGVFGGIRNWGDWVNVGLGFDGVLAIDARRLATPWMHHTSLMNVCLVVGSFAAALGAPGLRGADVCVPRRDQRRRYAPAPSRRLPDRARAAGGPLSFSSGHRRARGGQPR